MNKHKIAAALACVVFLTGVWGPIAAGATFTREILLKEEPWGAGKVFQILGPRHGEVVGPVTGDSGLLPGDYTQWYMSGRVTRVSLPGDFYPSFVVLPVPVEGPISIYTFDPEAANPPASYDPVIGDVFHLIVSGESYTYLPSIEFRVNHPKAELIFPDLENLFNFDNAPLAEGLSWRPVVTPAGGLDLLVVPEPATLLLLGAGAFGFLLFGRQRTAARCA